MKPVCLITGAGGVLGRALCSALIDRYEIVASYRSTLPQISSQIKRQVGPLPANKTAFCVQADLQKRDDIRRLVEVALAKHGRIDALINSAADMRFHGKLIELWQSEAYAESQLHINCIAPVNLVSAIHQEYWKDRTGENRHWNRTVINVSSMSGLYAYPDVGQGFYSASKAALNMLTLYLSLELAPYSVRANAVCPGRFGEPASTRLLVSAIEKLLSGNETGTIVSDFSSM
jgi:NAD(P)-dependent dehydrogenase (short-subunit alcohol dehydrogenase family)